MSTKIYGGLKFTPTKVVDRRGDDLHSRLQALRPVVEKWGLNAKAEFLAISAIHAWDKAVYQGTQAGDFMIYVSRARRDMDARQNEMRKSGLRDPAVDFEFKVFVIPHRGALYGMLFTDRATWRKKFMRLKWVEDYHYQDQTDRPSNVRAKEWAARSSVWGEILDADPRPIAHGFEYDLSPSNWTLPNWKQIARCIPPDDKRAASLTAKIAATEFKEGAGVSHMMEYLRSPEYKARKAELLPTALASLRTPEWKKVA